MTYAVFFSILSVSGLVVLPVIVLGFLYLNRKLKFENENLKTRKEMLALEVQKDTLRLKVLEKENQKLDRVIGDQSDHPPNRSSQ